MSPHPFQTDDPRLRPIAEKVAAGERLSGEEGLALYRSGDVLAVGWLANAVRERLHGDVTYFNVNRHINPTNVCVAACRLCAFGRHKGADGAYTMALEQAWETAASGYSEAVTEFHIVGGLHPDLPFEYFLDLVRGLKERFPQVHIKAFTMVEVAYLAKRAKLTIPADADEAEGSRRRFAARRRRGDFRGSRAPHHLRPQDRRRRVARDGARGPSDRAEIERDDALRTHRERRGPRRSSAEAAGAAGRDRRIPDFHSAGVSSRQHAAGALAEDNGA